jgi:hypothetical protein
LLADKSLERGDPGFVMLEKVSRCGVLVESASLIAFDPDADRYLAMSFRLSKTQLTRSIP